ncbi:MAG: carboxypeptidase regulatory-like domain-containing protein [Planctomycetes bacterium]|nr:carboxypeptidase regulatory-like domain-containing protein [Planctomycetota bacterium]
MPLPRAFACAFALLLAVGAFVLLRSCDASWSPVEERELARTEDESIERSPLVAPRESATRDVAAEELSGASATSETSKPSAGRRVVGAADDLLVEVRDPVDRIVSHLNFKLFLRLVGEHDHGDRTLHYLGRNPEGTEGPFRISREVIEESLARAKEAPRKYAGVERAELVLAVDAPSTPCTEHVLREGEVPNEVIILRLGPTGSVRVEVLDGAGTRLARELRFLLTEQREEGTSKQAQPWVSHERAEAGVYLFDLLRLGARFELEVQDASGRLHAEKIVFDGPRAEGECVAAQVRLTREAVLVVGRALDEHGAPLSSQDLSFTAHGPRGSVGSSARTDAAGRFEVPWSNRLASFSGIESIELTRNRVRGRDSVAERVRVVLPPLPETGSLDLGDLRLVGESALELLASGVVVDGAGRPVAEANLQVWEVWPPKQEGPWDEWRMLNDEFFAADQEGRFELRSRHRVRALRIAPQAVGYVPEKGLTVDPGATGLRLVLRRGASLVGSVQLPTALRFDQVSVLPHDGTRYRETARLDAEGRFRTSALKPGIYRFDVISQGRVLASVADVPLVEGEESRADSLDPLDLREALRLWKLRVLDGSGEPLAGHRCFAADGRVERSMAHGQSDRAGRLEFWTARDDEALTLVAADFLAQDVLWKEGEQELRFASASPHRFRVSGCAELAEEFRLAVSLRAPTGDSMDPRVAASASAVGRQTNVREGEILERVIAVPGRYEHRWLLRSMLNEQWIEFSTEGIQLGLEPPAEPIVIAPPRAELERAIAELRRRKVR